MLWGFRGWNTYFYVLFSYSLISSIFFVFFSIYKNVHVLRHFFIWYRLHLVLSVTVRLWIAFSVRNRVPFMIFYCVSNALVLTYMRDTYLGNLSVLCIMVAIIMWSANNGIDPTYRFWFFIHSYVISLTIVSNQLITLIWLHYTWFSATIMHNNIKVSE